MEDTDVKAQVGLNCDFGARIYLSVPL